MGGALAARDAYDIWAETYPPVAHNPVMRAEQSIVEPLLARARATRALDVGTGSGRYLPILQSTGARLVVGIDFSIGMLRAGLTPDEGGIHAPAPRLCGDARTLPFNGGAFDLINASLMAGDVVDLKAWTREIARVLARGGQFVYSDFHPVWGTNGWRRTFRTRAGVEHEVVIAPHAIEDHLAAIEAAGLTPLAIREPRIADDGSVAARSFRKQWGNPPVVVVFHAVKNPSGEGTPR